MRYNPWPEGGRAKTKAGRRSKAHSKAGHIGWSYRRDRKRGPKTPMRYLAAAGLSRTALSKYRSGRKTPAKTLLAKRVNRKRKSGRPSRSYITRPFLVNRKAGSYARFVGAFARRTGMRGPAMMRAAAKSWRGSGARRNGDPFPMTNNARRNQIPGLVYFNRGRKKSRGRSRRNGILPYLAFENRKQSRSRRGRSRRNGILPYAAFNRGYRRGGEGIVESFTGGLQTLITPDFWTENVIPLGVGFIGAQFVGGMIQGVAEKVLGRQTGAMAAIQRIGSRALGAVVLSGAALLVTKKGDMASKVLAGGLVAVFTAILQEIFGAETYSKMTGMSGISDMAADLTEELKAKIAQSVRGEIAAAEGGGMPGGVSAFVSTQDLSVAPDLGTGPRVGDPGMGSFVSTQELATAPVAAQGAPMVADLSAFSDSFADMMLV